MSSILAPPDELVVDDLSVRFGDTIAVNQISLRVARERVALVGESGSGKSTTGRAILRLAPPAAHVVARRLTFGELDLMAMRESELRRVRGRRITMILQDPRYSLHPTMRIGAQLAEAARQQDGISRAGARARALDMLAAVRIDDPNRVYDLYPHEISGGMGQRVMIAMMLIPGPHFVIADEPTSALDVVVRLQVLAILDDMVAQRGLGLLFISHDLNLVRSFCDRILIMYRGRIVEQLRASELDAARHPYTRGLLASMPHLANRGRRLPVLDRDPAWATPVA